MLMVKWRKARIKPVIVEFREVEGDQEIITTKEGTFIAKKDRHYIIRGDKGEEHPVSKGIFNEIYEVLEED